MGGQEGRWADGCRQKNGRVDEQKTGIGKKMGRETETLGYAPKALTILKNGETMLGSPSITHLIS